MEPSQRRPNKSRGKRTYKRATKLVSGLRQKSYKEILMDRTEIPNRSSTEELRAI